MAIALLLRHGRTTANTDGTLAGRGPAELDELGRAQAEAVRQRLRGLPLRTVVCSPLRRCRQTIEVALPATEPEIDERLTECGYGDWEGQSLKRLAKDPLWKVVQVHPAGATFPGAGGEPMAAMSARAVAAVRAWDARVGAEHGSDALWLACSHGDVIKAVVADALGLHLDLFQRLVVEPASITVIRYTPARPFLIRLNDTAAALTALVPPRRRRRARAGDSDATVGGGAGSAGSDSSAGSTGAGSATRRRAR